MVLLSIMIDDLIKLKNGETACGLSLYFKKIKKH